MLNCGWLIYWTATFFHLFVFCTSDGRRTAGAPLPACIAAFSQSSRSINNSLEDDQNASPSASLPQGAAIWEVGVVNGTNAFLKATWEHTAYVFQDFSATPGNFSFSHFHAKVGRDTAAAGHPHSEVVQSISKRSRQLRPPIRELWLSPWDVKHKEPPEIQSSISPHIGYKLCHIGIQSNALWGDVEPSHAKVIEIVS